MNSGRRSTGGSATTDTVVFLLLGTASVGEARLEAVLDPLQLSLAKASVPHHLAEAKEPVSLSELAQHQHCVRSNINQLIDRLEADGLVRRHPDPGDRRSVRAAPTRAGERA